MADEDQYKILFIEQDAARRATIERLLTDAGYGVAITDSAEKALSFTGEAIDCVIAGVMSGDISRMDLLKHWRAHYPEARVPPTSHTGTIETAVEAIRAAAAHSLAKPLDAHILLTRLMELVQSRRQDQPSKPPNANLASDVSIDQIIGHTPVMKDVFKMITRSSQAFSTVLILGESGTGKDLVAQAIHNNSARKGGPFIAVNCAAMPESLVESELFGYEKGAFTGAVGTRIGRFEAANGGTLFIDEIGDFALSLQAKLLRALENRIVTPLGGHREIKVDTRIVAATSRNIPVMVAKGQFREDLYYRLNIISIHLPPLRTRREDIPLLVESFITRINRQNHSAIESISPEAMSALHHYDWPGNVRQLLNTIERAMVLSDKAIINVEDLPGEILKGSDSSVPQNTGHSVNNLSHQQDDPPSLPTLLLNNNGPAMLLTLAQLEHEAIRVALIRYHNNKTQAAHAIGISVRTLQRKLSQQNADAPGE